MVRLSEMSIGQKGFVESVQDEGLQQYLLEMGITPGQMIKVERISPLSDPIAILVSNLLISIRVSDAKKIMIRSNDE